MDQKRPALRKERGVGGRGTLAAIGSASNALDTSGVDTSMSCPQKESSTNCCVELLMRRSAAGGRRISFG